MPVIYPNKLIEDKPLAVDILPEVAAITAADRILDLVIRGYSRGQEEPDGPLRPGTFTRTYDNLTARTKFRNERIPGVYRRGCKYLTVTDPRNPSRLAVVLKTLPTGAILL